MKLEPFAMERMQSTYENQVDFNLSESGVHPLHARRARRGRSRARRAVCESLRYTQIERHAAAARGDRRALPGRDGRSRAGDQRGRRSQLHHTWNLVEPGDEVVLMVPNYMQTWGLARAFGAEVRSGRCVGPDRRQRWRVDLDALERLVSPRTKLIIVCNPNNPTGARFEAGDLDRDRAIAGRHGSWILSDEIYRGAERDGRETPSVWGRYDRAIVTSGLSKAYGLPGLRIGWIVGPPRWWRRSGPIATTRRFRRAR